MKRVQTLILTFVIVLSCTILPVSALSVPFEDIWDLDEVTQDRIEYLYYQGIMNGTSSTTFSPHDYYTRSMFVTMLGRMMQVNVSDYSYSPFRDVPAGRWDAPYVAWAAEQGIVNGIGDGLFNPTGIITLEQYCAIICRFQDFVGFQFTYYTNIDSWPSDITNLYEASPYARDNLAEMVEVGLIDFTVSHYEDNRGTMGVYIEPKRELTRDWIAKYFGSFHYILHYDDSIVSYLYYLDSGSSTGETIETWVE